MGGLFDWLGKLVKSEAEHRTQIRVAPDHVLNGTGAPATPVAETHYVRIWLIEMFLRDGTSWFTKRYPLAYSLIEMNYGGQTTEFSNVSGKNRLDIKQTDIGRSLLFNYPLTPLLPFRGGTLSLDCGLVSMTASNAIQKFAGVVSEFAGKIGAAQVGSVTAIAASVAGSVQDLLGAGDAVSKLYYHNVFASATSGSPLASGFIFLSEAAEGKIDPARLWVTAAGIREGRSGEASAPLAPQDYLLFFIECTTERDDYRSFEYIREPFEQALEAKADSDDAKGQVLLRQAKRAVMKSPDFTALDRKRISAALDRSYAADGWTESVTESGVRAGNDLETDVRDRFTAAIRSVSIDEASALPDPDLP